MTGDTEVSIPRTHTTPNIVAHADLAYRLHAAETALRHERFSHAATRRMLIVEQCESARARSECLEHQAEALRLQQLSIKLANENAEIRHALARMPFDLSDAKPEEHK